MMKHQISIFDTCQCLLDRYYISVLEAPNKVSEVSEDLAFALIYLVNKYAEEFQSSKWLERFCNISKKLGEINTIYRDMVIFQAPIWCCLGVIERSWYWIDKVLVYGLSQGSMGRMIFLEYVYLINGVIDHTQLHRFVSWYCKEGKICVDPLLYIFMNSSGTEDEKLAYLQELYKEPEVRRYPQVPGAIESFIKKEFVCNPFSHVDQIATNTIIDLVMFRDLTMSEQLEICLFDDQL